MKAITLHQPYASAIAVGLKRFETRSWRTNHRGLLAIHAGLKRPLHVGHDIALLMAKYRMDYGAIVAVAEVTRVISTDDGILEASLPQPERLLGDFSPGRFGWLLENVRPLAEPIPIRGAQGLWTVPDDVAARVMEQMA